MNASPLTLARLANAFTLTAITTTSLCACGVVGWKYRYENHEYTMTRENSEYHQTAIRDVRTRFGDPSAERDVAKLKGACELLQKYAANAPDGGSFTSARDLLDAEARSACHNWHQQEAELASRAEQQRHRDEYERAQQQREHDRTAARQKEERDRLTATLTRATRTVEACDATEAARAARKRHAEIAQKAPGALVRKQCTPHIGTTTVTTQCKDDNGFVRACTKSVANGEVTGYTCPKTMDAEVVALGLYQLDLLDTHPFPEDRAIPVRDDECEDAKARQKQTREKLEGLSSHAQAVGVAQ